MTSDGTREAAVRPGRLRAMTRLVERWGDFYPPMDGVRLHRSHVEAWCSLAGWFGVDCHAEVSLCRLAEAWGVSESAASRRLARLAEVGLVAMERGAGVVFLRLPDPWRLCSGDESREGEASEAVRTRASNGSATRASNVDSASNGDSASNAGFTRASNAGFTRASNGDSASNGHSTRASNASATRETEPDGENIPHTAHARGTRGELANGNPFIKKTTTSTSSEIFRLTAMRVFWAARLETDGRPEPLPREITDLLLRAAWIETRAGEELAGWVAEAARRTAHGWRKRDKPAEYLASTLRRAAWERFYGHEPVDAAEESVCRSKFRLACRAQPIPEADELRRLTRLAFPGGIPWRTGRRDDGANAPPATGGGSEPPGLAEAFLARRHDGTKEELP